MRYQRGRDRNISLARLHLEHADDIRRRRLDRDLLRVQRGRVPHLGCLGDGARVARAAVVHRVDNIRIRDGDRRPERRERARDREAGGRDLVRDRRRRPTRSITKWSRHARGPHLIRLPLIREL